MKKRTNNRKKDYDTKYKRLNRDKYNMLEAKRRVRCIKATPEWCDKVEVEYIYSLAAKKGWAVDHIVPLNSGLVCGLNVQDNLRVIPAELNSYKGNRYWPDMPDNTCLKEEHNG